MPTYNLECECGEKRQRTLLKTMKQMSAAERDAVLTCRKCGKTMKRVTSTSTMVKETLDNGAMTHAVERLKDAEELYRDRSKNDPRLKP